LIPSFGGSGDASVGDLEENLSVVIGKIAVGGAEGVGGDRRSGLA